MTVQRGYAAGEVRDDMSTPRLRYGYSNNEYHLLSLDNPEVYRDLTPPEELPLGIYDELPA